MDERTVVVVGSTRGIGLELARHYVEAGRKVAITGRSQEGVAAAAAELGGDVSGFVFDLAEPKTIAAALAGIGPVDRLALVALQRDLNNVRDYNIDEALYLVTMKLVGYTEVVHVLADRMGDDASIVIFGGLAKERPYPGSTTVTTVNHGVDGLVRAMVHQLAPIRVNAIHPGIAADSPFWAPKQEALVDVLKRTHSGTLVRMQDVVDAAVFLLENPAMNGTELRIDGGWSLP